MADALKKKGKRPRRIDAAYLERAGLFYLERFAASSDSLRRVLSRKVERAARETGDDPAVGLALIEPLIVRFLELGFLDDKRYAENKVQTLFRRGASQKNIRLTLRQKGVDADVTDAALVALRDEAGTENMDMQAAVRLARRRRLGPFRQDDEIRLKKRSSDMAALARAGFSSDIARRVVLALSIDDLEDEEGHA